MCVFFKVNNIFYCFSHVVFAPSSTDSYSGVAFSGLTDVLNAIQTTTDEKTLDQLWRTFSEHLAAVTHFIYAAGDVLSDNLW